MQLEIWDKSNALVATWLSHHSLHLLTLWNYGGAKLLSCSQLVDHISIILILEVYMYLIGQRYFSILGQGAQGGGGGLEHNIFIWQYAYLKGVSLPLFSFCI